MTREEKLAQYKHLLETGAIDQNDYETLVAPLASSTATLTGSGAVSQDGRDALGQGVVKVEGTNHAPINTGTQINAELLQYITIQGEDPEIAKSVIALYLDALVKDLTGLKLGEIDTSIDKTKQQQLQLADIYVPLNTTLQIPEKTTLAHWLKAGHKREQIESEKKNRPVSALEALAEHRELTLLGIAGSGKSTFGNHVLLKLALACQRKSDALAELGKHWMYGSLLPIRVILRRFAETLPAGNLKATAGDIWEFIASDLKSSGFGMSAQTCEYIQRIARTQGAMILFDGLDECGDSGRRKRVLGAVEEFMTRAGHHCRFLLTARPYAFPEGSNPDKGIYTLANLDDNQIEQFITAWYEALVKRGWSLPAEADRKKTDLLAVRKCHDLLPLAQNPLLLTLMTTLHTNRGRMPDDKVDLYNESVDLLMLRWNRQMGADKALLDELDQPGLKLSDLREALEELAFTIHEKSVGREGAADIGEDKLVRTFCSLLNKDKSKADKVVQYIEKRAGLLVGQGEKDGELQFTFPHRTFQEYLAACHLAAKEDFPEECVRLARAAAGHWQIALSLAARIAKAGRFGDV